MADEKTAPGADDLEKGAAYVFRIAGGRHSPGAVYDRQGAVALTYESRPVGFGKRSFIARTPDGKEAVRIFRLPGFVPRFTLLEKDAVTATIAMKSVLRNKYAIAFTSGPSWTFGMPLFAVNFYGRSDAGPKVWVQAGPSKMQWNLLIQRGADSIPLVAALAFIHRRWWDSG